mgnify:CR=1 FL=1
MFGDDSDPTVTTERVGFGTTFGRTHEGGLWLCREVRWFDKRETQARLVSERSTKARGDTATTSRNGFYENIWMRCT